MRPKLDTTKYAIIYPRQSTGEQVENNVYSLARQLALKEVALRDGFPEDLIMVVEDDLGMSGRTIDKRPGFTRALKMIEKGLVAALYAEDQTRLSRDERTIDHMRIADVCERAGTLVYIGGSWYDMRDSGQRQSFKYQAVGGSEYWKAHLGKLKEAQRRKALEGKAVAAPPRGYRVNKEGSKRDPNRDRLMVYEPEANIIRELVAELPDAGSITALYKRRAPIFWPDGVTLKYDALHRILTAPTYRGTYTWGDVRVEGAHEAIITPEQASEIDSLIAYNRAVKRRPEVPSGAEVAGVVWCATCRRQMTTNKGGHSPHYRCQPTKDGVRAAGEYHFSVDVTHVDLAMRALLFERLSRGLVDGILANITAERERRAIAGGNAEGQMRILERKIDGWMQSLSDPDLPEPVRKRVQSQMEEAIGQMETLNRPRADVAHLDDAYYHQLRRDPEAIGRLALTWEDEPLDWRRRFVRRFAARAEVGHGHGGLELTMTWLDGTTSTGAIATRSWTMAEVEALHAICAHPDCPPIRMGRLSWIYNAYTARGYQRPRLGVRKKLFELGLLSPKQAAKELAVEAGGAR